MESRINHVKTETRTNAWMNGKGGYFKYDDENVWYQLIEITPDLQSYIISPVERNTENCPVLALGFVAYLIRNWGRPETEIYNEYYNRCLAKYINIESKLPGSFNRDLNTENYVCHLAEEQKRVSYSEKIYPYITGKDVELIKAYIDSYFDYIKFNYSEKTGRVKVNGVVPFSFYLKNIEKKDEMTMFLKERYPSGKNKECAMMIAALWENNILELPDKMVQLYNSLAAEWKIENFDRRGHESILKKWWLQIDKEWLLSHKIEYPSEVIHEINFLKDKIKEIETKELTKN